jgi:putative peptidoglycan lipid II flippase
MSTEPGSHLTAPSFLASPGPVLASAAMLAAATVLVKLLALVKDWMVARQFGAGDELDAFLIAFLVPSFGVAVLGHSFAQAFLPTYLRVHQQDSPAAARRLVGGLLVRGLLLLVAVSLLLALGAPYLVRLVGSGFSVPKLALAQSLFFYLLPVLVAGGISCVLAAALNAQERFAAAALAPLAVPLAMVVGFAAFQDRFGIYALAGGTVAGFLLETCLLAAAAWRANLLGWPTAQFSEGMLTHIASRYWPVVVGTLLMSSSAVVDQSMAASLGSGNVSVLSFGGKVVGLVLAVVAASLSTVLFPRFAQLSASGEAAPLRRALRVYVRLILFGSIPIVAVLMAGAEPIIRLLFERGAFTPETTAAVSRVQFYLALQVPFYVLAMVGARVLSALDGNQIVLRIGALCLALNVAGDYLLMQWFGVDGIAMATSLVYLVAAGVTFAAIRVKLRESNAPASDSMR